MTTFAFLDIETTGLSPVNNYILEVAWVFTDKYFDILPRPPRSFIVDHEDAEADVVRQIKESSFITNMHTKSGLLVDLADPDAQKHKMDDILGAFVADLVSLGRIDDQVRFAGYSVSFDREFLRANGWRSILDEDNNHPFHMHHRILDLSSVKQVYDAAETFVPETAPNENPHRALDDALDALAVAQAFRNDIGARTHATA